MYDNLFYKELSKNKEKLQKFKNAIKKGKIMPFDVATLSKLRRIYYSCYSGIIYLYGEETNFETIGNKVEILSHVFAAEDYNIVHAETDSTRDIAFFKYQRKHLDFNSYYEIKRGTKTYIYDTFSMLMFEKEVYEELEHPKISRIVPKKLIQSNPLSSEDREAYRKPHDLWLIRTLIVSLERSLENNPYQEILKKEIARYKEEIGYEDLLLSNRCKELGIYDYQKIK